jgi:iron(III) transport system permease protein
MLIGILVFAVLLIGVLYPNVFTFVESFFPNGTFSLATYLRFFETPSAREALFNSLFISLATVVLSAAIGIPLAFLLHRYDFRGRRILRAIASAPVLLPPLVGVISFLFLYGESGIISRSLQIVLGLDRPFPRLTGVSAILFIHAYSMYVYFFMFTSAGLERLDASMEEAAETLGASGFEKLRRVTLPLLVPSFVGASLVTFMSSMASFSAPLIFGGGIRVLAVEIFNAKLNGNIPMALVETVILAGSSLSVLFLLRWYEGRSRYSLTGKGVSVQRKPIGSGFARVAAGLCGTVAVVFLILPHLMVFVMSFVRDGSWTTQLIPPQYTTENYLRLFRDPSFFEPIRNSLWMSALATAANLAWGLMATFWLRRRTGMVRRIADILIVLPWALPGTVVAIAMVESFSSFAGTVMLLPFLYFVRNIPIVVRAIDASFQQVDPSIEEAAISLGASSLYTIRRVVLPLVLPGAIAGSLLAFITALGEFVSSIMVYVYTNRPISIEILSQLRGFNFGTASAYGFLLIVLIAITLLVGERLNGPLKDPLMKDPIV